MLQTEITANEIKAILGNNGNRKKYLRELFKATGNTEKIEQTTPKLDEQIINTWSYEQSAEIIRSIFKTSPKYIDQQKCEIQIDEAIKEWKEMGFGSLEWPFSAMGFDQHVHILNRRSDITEKEKDDILSKEIIRFHRIKQLNALRNDYIEYLIFQNENVIPTFGNRRSVDFYIHGKPYDQKVGKSVGKAFIDEYGDEYRTIAITHPELVAKSLYENQDEERFGDESRLFVVYLDNDVASEKIKQQLSRVDFSRPYEITFEYKHSNNITVSHTSECFVILLHN